LHIVSRRHGIPHPVSTLAPLGEGLQDQLPPTPVRGYMSTHFLGVSGSFVKIVRKACFHGVVASSTSQMQMPRCKGAIEDVMVQGNAYFPSFSFAWFPVQVGLLAGLLLCTGIHRVRYRERFEGVLVSAWYK